MNKVKVKVFDINSCSDEDFKYYEEKFDIDEYLLYEFDSGIVRKNGTVLANKAWRKELNPIKPLEKHIKEKIKYELDESEKMALSMLKNTERQLADLQDSAKRKRERYEQLLLNKISDTAVKGEYWDCELSPFGHCIYEYDANGLTCIFCGQPEERK